MQIIEEVANFYRIIKLKPFRKTQGVVFDLFPIDALSKISSIDRVIHQDNAISPSSVGSVERPWYMHPFQADNLIVLHGKRHVELFTKEHGKVESFTVYPDKIYKNGELLFEGGNVLVWPCNVFHRIQSGEEGSASLNFAIHSDGYDIRTNFNIYDLNTETG
ncbi:hypothetical protein, partial [Serpentinicella alkaliphila]